MRGKRYGRHNAGTVLAELQSYSGDNAKVAGYIELLAGGCDDRQQDAVAEAVAELANTLPACGPVLALEIVGALSRFWAKGSSQ